MKVEITAQVIQIIWVNRATVMNPQVKWRQVETNNSDDVLTYKTIFKCFLISNIPLYLIAALCCDDV